MGFMKPELPPIDPARFEELPTLDRIKIMSQHWVDHGFGTPKMLNVVYLMKTIMLVALGWLIIGLTTPGLGLLDMSEWWGELIVLQKAMIFMVLIEVAGFGCSWGPLSFKFSPMTTGPRHWLRPKTLRSPPYPERIPLTAGDSRTIFDVLLYLSLVLLLIVGLVMPGQRTAAAYSDAGLVVMWPLVAYVVLLLIMGLRDKVPFLASRPEQYAVTLLAFGLLATHTDMIVVAKIAMFAVWFGAGVSKFGFNFSPVVKAMLSNTPWLTSKRFKRSLYRDAPNDLRPSRVAWTFGHIGGTLVELALPLVLIFSTNWTLTALAVASLMAFHLFIYSAFALAVPQEWNIFFVLATPFVFLGFFNGDGYAIWDVGSVWVLGAALVLTLGGPILGNFKPGWVSFLISMRQYAGNWSSCIMAFRIEGVNAESKLDDPAFVKAGKSFPKQLEKDFGLDVGEMFLQKSAAFRAMHSHGPALLSLMQTHVDDLDNYRLREGEAMASLFLGWMFGDGHLNDVRTIAAIQKRCNFEPGEFIITWNESQPQHTHMTKYKVIDAALGLVEVGHYDIRDSSQTQPWLPDGPINYTMTWRKPGYEPPVERATLGVTS